MRKQNAGNALGADNLMKETNRVVGQAMKSMGDLTVSMRDITAASDETSKIIKTIDDIAFQTNLLALNAAVGRPGPERQAPGSLLWRTK